MASGYGIMKSELNSYNVLLNGQLTNSRHAKWAGVIRREPILLQTPPLLQGNWRPRH